MKVYVWGFEPEELRRWPAELELVPAGEWPAAAPLVVHGRALARFQAAARAHPRPDGRLPEAILYLPQGTRAPAGSWAYCDATVREGDWAALMALLACPRQVEMGEMAEEVPVTFLQALAQPVAALAPGQFPLPAAVQEHLATCATCREAFNRALEDRLWLRRQGLCPAVEQLAAYVRGVPDSQVARHLESCRACQAQVTVLRRELAPAWLAIPLANTLAETAEQAPESLADAPESWQLGLMVLAAVMNGCLRAQLAPVGPWSRARGAEGPLQSVEIGSLLEHLQRGQEVFLVRPHRDLTLGWDGARRVLWIGYLHGERKSRVADFRVEVRRSDEVLWTAGSQEGRVTVPLGMLQETLESGADQLVILA